MPQGVRTTNLPTGSTVVELIGNKDLGGGAKQTVRISLSDFLAYLQGLFDAQTAGMASDAQRALGLASNALVRISRLEFAAARAVADAARAVGLATNASIRLKKLDDVQIVLRAQVFN